MEDTIIIIPARMGSTRFPNKPLADIAGKSMIVRVLEQAEKTGVNNIVIAAAEQEIAAEAEKNGYKAILTEPNLPSGTDRIYEAYDKFSDKQSIKYIVNLQGDLPTIDPKVITDLLNYIKNSHNNGQNFDIVTAVAKITKPEERENNNVVKAIVAWDSKQDNGKALYFTRATAPHNSTDLYHHIGMYIYTASALEKFVKLPPSNLEVTEKLEQLRALENDMKIGVLKVDTVPLGVDTEADQKIATQMFENNQVK